MNRYIKIFDTEYEQKDFLKCVNKENDYPLLLLNKENNHIYVSSDGTLEKTIKYNNENYLNFDKNDINNEFHIIPNDINNLIISDVYTNEQEIINIPRKYNRSYNQYPLYKVGLMSDVHYNDTDTDTDPDTNITNDGAEYSEDLRNALQFFINQNVDFVACSGDISSDWSDHIKNYGRCITKYFSNIPIFTCSGNHDTKPKYKYHDVWQSISALNANNYNIVYFKDYEQYSYKVNGEYDNFYTNENGEGTSFYIKKYYNDTFDVYIYLNVEYGWNDRDNYPTHNCRLLTQEELLVHSEVDEVNDLHLYHPQTLECLAEILEEFKDHRCFIFTHLMLPDKAGNFHTNNTSNNTQYYDYADYNKHADVLRGDQGEFIRNLMETYDNNYWFCGHSHYKWDWEKYDHNINITKTGNSYNIHLPSLSRPLPLEITSYQTAPKDSEAGIMEVYKDYVIIKGVVMKEEYNNLDINKLLREYPDENMVYATPSMFTVINNQSNVQQLEDNYIQINYNFDSSINSNMNNIYLNNDTIINASNFGNYMPVLRFEDIKVWKGDSTEYDSTNDITYEILNENKVGFRDHTTNDNYFYYLKSNHIYTLNNYAIEYSNYGGVVGIVFKTSGDSIYKTEKLHFRFKLKLGYVHIGYINKFLPIACFKLPTNVKEED